MTRSELINRIAEMHPNLKVTEVDNIVTLMLDEITKALEDDKRVEIRGFGAFTAKKRNARTGRNPRTGESVQVSEKVVPFFKAGKQLLDRLNERA